MYKYPLITNKLVQMNNLNYQAFPNTDPPLAWICYTVQIHLYCVFISNVMTWMFLQALCLMIEPMCFFSLWQKKTFRSGFFPWKTFILTLYNGGNYNCHTSPPTSSTILSWKFVNKNQKKWHLTCDTWHVTHDTWQMGEAKVLSKYQLPSLYCLEVKVFWRYFHKVWVSQSFN